LYCLTSAGKYRPLGATDLGVFDCAKVKEELDWVDAKELIEAESPPPQPVIANKKLIQDPTNAALVIVNQFSRKAFILICLY
jgi:hypothetical protein